MRGEKTMSDINSLNAFDVFSNVEVGSLFGDPPSWEYSTSKCQDGSLTYIIKNNSSDSLEKDSFALPKNTAGIKTLILYGVTKVGDSVFENYPDLEEVIFEDIFKESDLESTVSIGQNAFKNCSKLKWQAS